MRSKVKKNRKELVWFDKKRKVIVYDVRNDPEEDRFLRHPRRERGRKGQ